jgi:hypothetical protein
MLGHQRAGAQALLDLGQRHARAQQLRARHDTVCRTRDPGQFLLHRPTLRSHYDL